MRTVLLVAFITVSSCLWAQETYYYTVDPRKDTVLVYDENRNVVILYSKNEFIFKDMPVRLSRDKKAIVFSGLSGELGRVASKRYRKIILADGSEYRISSGKRNFSYKKNGIRCAGGKYSFTANGGAVVELYANDSSFLPFLFQTSIAHIKGTQLAEQLFWINLM
ncbi:MAG: hypothetical protein LBC47_08815, partial [Tannerella sp.]|nr:hypothetical protein [Tannerella sp.]